MAPLPHGAAVQQHERRRFQKVPQPPGTAHGMLHGTHASSEHINQLELSVRSISIACLHQSVRYGWQGPCESDFQCGRRPVCQSPCAQACHQPRFRELKLQSLFNVFVRCGTSALAPWALQQLLRSSSRSRHSSEAALCRAQAPAPERPDGCRTLETPSTARWSCAHGDVGRSDPHQCQIQSAGTIQWLLNVRSLQSV